MTGGPKLLGIFAHAWIFSLIIVVLTGCEWSPTPLPTPTNTPAITATPVEATPEPEAGRLVLTPEKEVVPFHTYHPAATRSAVDGHPVEKTGVYIILDNQVSLKKECDIPLDSEEPVEHIALMSDVTEFLVSLFAAYHGQTEEQKVNKIDIGVMHIMPTPGEHEEEVTLDMIPLQPASSYKGLDWVEQLDSFGDELEENGFGYAEAITTAGLALSDDKYDKEIIVMFTDGYFGGRPSYAGYNTTAELKRQELEETIANLKIENPELDINVILIRCDGLQKNELYAVQDIRFWYSLVGKDLLGITDVFEEGLDVHNLISEVLNYNSVTPLLPNNGHSEDEYLYGYQLLGAEHDESGHSAVANTQLIKLHLVSLGANGFSVEAERDGDPLIDAQLKQDFRWNNYFTKEFSPAREFYGNCNPFSWRINGPPEGAIYWWETVYPEYQVSMKVDPAIANNSDIDFSIDISGPDDESLLACYELRVSLFSEANRLLESQTFELDEDLKGVFSDYLFNPIVDEKLQLTVAAEVLETNDGQPVTYSAAYKERGVRLNFHPLLENSWIVANGDMRTVSMNLAFATDHYFDSDLEDPQVYMLNSKSHAELNRIFKELEECRESDAMTNKLLFLEGFSGDFKSAIEVHEGQADADEPMDDVLFSWFDVNGSDSDKNESLKRRIDVRVEDFLIGEDGCYYEGVMLQWPEHDEWDSVLCTLNSGDSAPCSVLPDLRIEEQ